MPHFDHTGPHGKGCRTGRMGQPMQACGGKAGNAAQHGRGQQAEEWQDASIAAGQSAEKTTGRGCCHRHGQGCTNMGRNRAMHGQAGAGASAGAGAGAGAQGRGRATGQGRCMAQAGQAESCGTSQPAYGDGSDNKS